MDYKVICYKCGKVERREVWVNHSFETIRHQAKEWIEQEVADRVTVRDSFGKWVIRYPEWKAGPRPNLRRLTSLASGKKRTFG